MRSNRVLYIGLALAVVLVGVLVVFLFAESDNRYNWTETFDNDGNQPYDLSLFRNAFDSYFPEREMKEIGNIRSDTAMLAGNGKIFFYVDARAHLDSADATLLREFTERGNTVFISAVNSHRLLQFVGELCGGNGKKELKKRKAKRIIPFTSTAKIDSSATINYTVIDKEMRYPWTYYDLESCAEVDTLGSFAALGTTFPNFIGMESGAGNILLHSTPLVFTNFHLRDTAVFAHVNDLLSHLPEGDILYYSPSLSTQSAPNRPLITESPLRFILGNESLRWAWYITILLALIFVLNAMRRNQRPIPVIAKTPSGTANHLDVVSRLYRKDGKHKHIVQIQEKILLNHLRNKYRLNTGTLNEQFFREASIRLQMETGTVKSFFGDLNRAKHDSTLSDETLKSIDLKITEFYKKCP